MAEFGKELAASEKVIWTNGLGSDVEVPLPPSYLTPELVTKLKHEGFTTVAIPIIDLSQKDPNDLNVGRFLEELQNRYPGWRTYEAHENMNLGPLSVWWNLGSAYWQDFLGKLTEFPKTGLWMAVEDMPKPVEGDRYTATRFNERLQKVGCPNRFHGDKSDIDTTLRLVSTELSKELRIDGITVDIRLLKLLEWNLLGNRFRWDAARTCEWTQTTYSAFPNGEPHGYFLTGNFEHGGTAHVGRSTGAAIPIPPRCWRKAFYPDYTPKCGFRVAIELS